MRVLFPAVLLASASLLGGQDSPSSDPPAPPPRLGDRLRPGDFAKTRRAIETGLEWLAQCQAPDGSWSCKVGYKLNENYFGSDGKHVGVTSLAAMAFMAAGSFPDRGKYSQIVRKALDFVLGCIRAEDGYITSNGTRMYEHSFAVMFLAHIYGMTHRADVRDKLKRSVTLLVQAQNREGGWRYQPQPVDADISVTVSVLQGLRSAKAGGISVPIDTIDRAMKYIRDCASPWGFQYQSDKRYQFNDTRTSYALTAAGVVSMNSAGIYDSQEIRNGLEFLRSQYNRLRWSKYHFFYGHYYACQAMYVAGGKAWNDYYDLLRRDIVNHQDGDGGWTDDVGRTYATAMACLVLQIPTEWFPIFQK